MTDRIENTLFVTGTDTSVGKTYFCARFLEFMRAQNIDAGYQKWAATGSGGGLPEDVERCLAAAGITPTKEKIEQMVPYSFRFPASPHLAGEMEDREIEPQVIIDRYKKLSSGHEWLIVEGVGGILVPLRRDLFLVDIAARLQPTTLVVAKSGLGTLNHTLLTLEALRTRKIPVLGVVFSDQAEHQDERLVEDNILTVKEMGLVRIFGRMKRYEDEEEARKAFKPIGRAVFEQLQYGAD